MENIDRCQKLWLWPGRLSRPDAGLHFLRNKRFYFLVSVFLIELQVFLLLKCFVLCEFWSHLLQSEDIWPLMRPGNIGINHVIIAQALLTYGSGMGETSTLTEAMTWQRTHNWGSHLEMARSKWACLGQVSNTGQHLSLGLSWHFPDTIVNCSLHQGLTSRHAIVPHVVLQTKHCSTFASFALRITSPWCYATLGLVSLCVQSSPKHWHNIILPVFTPQFLFGSFLWGIYWKPQL